MKAKIVCDGGWFGKTGDEIELKEPKREFIKEVTDLKPYFTEYLNMKDVFAGA